MLPDLQNSWTFSSVDDSRYTVCDVALLGVLQLPNCATTSQWNVTIGMQLIVKPTMVNVMSHLFTMQVYYAKCKFTIVGESWNSNFQFLAYNTLTV